MTTTRTLLTIVTESALETILMAELTQLGVHGCTVTDARGFGRRGPRQGSWNENSNVRIEIVCDRVTAERVAARLQDQYYAHYGMILFMADVSVLRPEKF